MSDENKTNDTKKKTLSLGGGGTLSLGAGSDKAKKSISSVRTRAASVAVEVKNTRRHTKSQDKKTNDGGSRILTDKERQARQKALSALGDGNAPRRSALPARQPTHRPSEVSKPKTDGIVVAPPPPSSKKDEASEKRSFGEEPASQQPRQTTEREAQKKKTNNLTQRRPMVRSRRGGRITVTQAVNRDYERDRAQSLAAQRRARKKARLAAEGPEAPAAKILHEVVLPETISVQDLASRMAEPSNAVIKSLMKMGVMVTINQSIDADTAELVAEEFGHSVKRITDADVEEGLGGEEDSPESMQPRAPVVTIMGHVDHGKTSLLDAMRKSRVTEGESGGITQHIGAYQVCLHNGKKITFLDTPGHEAFTQMRARGAGVTDIVVIVVAADDSIMPQTIEAISHAKAAGVPIIIAINKIDLSGANPDKIRQDLLQHDVQVEDMGGDVLCVEISAKNATNLDKLDDAILLQTEMLELSANPDKNASGIIIESKQERGRGSVATVLVQSGTLKVGDVFVAGAETGKVRALVNDMGEQVKEAIPGQPVEVLGLGGTPRAGDSFNVVGDEARAREVAIYRQRKMREIEAASALKGRMTLEQLLENKDVDEKTMLPIVVKADVSGSIEAIIGSLEKVMEENEDVEIRILHSGVGGITESDVTLARASNGIVIGFNVRAGTKAAEMSKRDGVDIKYYSVIYDMVDEIKETLSGMLSPNLREEALGMAEVREVFHVSKVGNIAGCMVTKGLVRRDASLRLLRDDVVVYSSSIAALKRFKDDAKEVREGMECGIAIKNYNDVKAGDIIECFGVTEEARKVK